MHDGSITFSTALDNEQLEKELARLKRRVFKLEGEILEKESRRNDLVERRKRLNSEINELQQKRKLLDGDAFADTSAVNEKISDIRGEISTINKEIGTLDTSLDSINSTLNYTKTRFGEVSELEKTLTREFDTSTISGRLEKASYELAQISAKGKGLGDQEYDQAYRNLALLTAEARKYQRELSKTPEQMQAEREREELRQQAVAKQISEAVEAQIAEQRLLDIKESVVVSDQHIVDLNQELVRLKERQAELQRAGIGTGYEEYDKNLQRVGEINAELREYQNGLIGVSNKAKATNSSMAKLGARIGRLASRVFVFTMITTALRAMRGWIGKAIKTNDEARASIAQLKGALLTLAQPLVEVVIPAFTLLINILTRIITAVAQFVSMLFGKTLKQSRDGAKALHKEANAIGAVGEAADEAAGSLAGFDEINTISTENAGGAGGGAVGENIAPDFSWADDMDGLAGRLKEIADLVGLIAAGLALWKIGSMFPGVLGQIATILGGILLTVGGLLLFWNGLTDAWENGVDWLNLIEMIGGLAAAAFGLYTVFEALHPGWGKIAAGIALVVGGIAMLVTGFHDAMENGWNLQNALLSIAGVLATGLGIALLTGSWIPLLIAGIASVLLALTIATGHGEELLDGIRTIMEGFVDFFTGVFTGDIEKAIGGISKIFDGLKTAVFAVIDGIKDTLLSFLTWLDEKTGGRFHGIIETAKGFVTEFFTSTKETLGNVLDAVKQIFTGIIQFLTGVFTNDWDIALNGIQNIFKGAWNGIVSLLEGAVNLIIRGLNWLISQMNKISFTVPNWIPGVGGKSFGISIPSIPETKIPRLAQGAVIPPNREFMAVLGDQRHGNNLEAPEDLIRKIVREESGGGDGQVVMLLQSLLEAVKAGHIIMVDKAVLGRTARDGIDDITIKSGKFALLF